ncbi:MAG: GatB/YqeY domain-containing protein [Candidatus Omnitrophota bacterium]|nr:MAG: GatB/YqeY domain-containing protein [Candidatus Omnitrophota bacterium]
MIEKIESDFKEALKRKDTIAISTLRMLKAAIHNKQIEKKGEKLQEAEVVKIISKQVQQHQDSIEQFKKGNRQELVEKETKELQILKKYLPEQLSSEEITKVVDKVIAETGAKDKSDFGKVMKTAMAHFKGQADGKLVSQIVSARLNKEK